jgi:hypothetical protein
VAVVFDPAQYRLARALIARHAGCELWYGPAQTSFDDPRLAELHDLAVQRATLEFVPHHAAGEPAFRQNAPLWDRLEELTVAQR